MSEREPDIIIEVRMPDEPGQPGGLEVCMRPDVPVGSVSAVLRSLADQYDQVTSAPPVQVQTFRRPVMHTDS